MAGHKVSQSSSESPGPGSALREITGEELVKILEEHRRWVETGGKEGIQAELGRANLELAELSEADSS